jgi:hypothetical protein
MHRIIRAIIRLSLIIVPSSLAFSQTAVWDPHDINGIWIRTGGDRGYNNDVVPMTAWGQEKFNSYKPSYGRELGSADAAAHSEEAIGRRRAVPSGLGNDPTGECNPSGIPRLLFFPRPIEFVQTPTKTIQFFQWTRAWRDIWTDGRKLPAEPPSLTWYGYSAGKWDGDIFVVDSTGFDDRSWVDHFGYPHSDQMHIQERYRRVDHDHLELTISLTDPKTYTRPWVSQKKVFTLQPPGSKSVSNEGWFGLFEEICAPVDEVDQFNARIRNRAVNPTDK